jgi:hypothetical protein
LLEKGILNGVICREQKERKICQKRDKYVHRKAEKKMKIYTIFLSSFLCIPLLHMYSLIYTWLPMN